MVRGWTLHTQVVSHADAGRAGDAESVGSVEGTTRRGGATPQVVRALSGGRRCVGVGATCAECKEEVGNRTIQECNGDAIGIIKHPGFWAWLVVSDPVYYMESKLGFESPTQRTGLPARLATPPAVPARFRLGRRYSAITSFARPAPRRR